MRLEEGALGRATRWTEIVTRYATSTRWRDQLDGLLGVC